MNKTSVTIKECMEQLQAGLDNYYDKKEARNLLRIILSEILKVPVYKLSTEEDRVVSQSEYAMIQKAFSELENYRPVQYITGKTGFYGLEFIVNEAVLIPRPETEELVNLVIKQDTRYNSILDIGTGSGAIAVSLKYNLVNSEVVAADISEKALEVARINAKRNNTKVKFVHLDFLDEKQWVKLGGGYDCIVSNPPYVRYSERAVMKRNVLDHEPGKALFIEDERPLVFYEKFIGFAKECLKKPVSMFFEINENAGNELLKLFEPHFETVIIKKDINGKNRFLIIRS
jgi:release factor glutamine methyltransferase